MTCMIIDDKSTHLLSTVCPSVWVSLHQAQHCAPETVIYL